MMANDPCDPSARDHHCRSFHTLFDLPTRRDSAHHEGMNPMDIETRVKIVCQVLEDWGRACRNDWSRIDGRAVRGDVGLICAALQGRDTPNGDTDDDLVEWQASLRRRLDLHHKHPCWQDNAWIYEDDTL